MRKGLTFIEVIVATIFVLVVLALFVPVVFVFLDDSTHVVGTIKNITINRSSQLVNYTFYMEDGRVVFGTTVANQRFDLRIGETVDIEFDGEGTEISSISKVEKIEAEKSD